MDKLVGLVFLLCGLGLLCAAVAAEIAWLGFFFGTVIVGIGLLFFAPALLLLPLAVSVEGTITDPK
ncbi:hypothetical protein [Herbaspirillum sp. SJZ107]|uniref:hypothetical protein n=1 Tax=Herbaspirillum sp. SJZ107 TaxID=2572881 RepID=UPI00114F304E|nr:hypothetical protein [Herbaspirillum sp. SJZ107]